LTGNESTKISIREIVLKGTIIALIVTIPSLSAFVLIWTLLDDLFLGVILGAFVHFIAMGFSLKISKKILAKNR
jgi:hypothetical protein